MRSFQGHNFFEEYMKKFFRVGFFCFSSLGLESDPGYEKFYSGKNFEAEVKK